MERSTTHRLGRTLKLASSSRVTTPSSALRCLRASLANRSPAYPPLFQPGEQPFHTFDNALSSNAIMHICFGDHHAHQQPHRVHHDMALSPVDLLIAVKPLIWNAPLAVPHRLRVDDAHAVASLAMGFNPNHPAKPSLHASPNASEHQLAEVLVHRNPAPKTLGQYSPLATAAYKVKYAILNCTQTNFSFSLNVQNLF